MRSLWSGSISFGLVNIPVKLYTASRERALKFRMLDKTDHCPVSYQKVCRDDNKVIDAKDVVKAYEIEKGEFVILTPEDFKKAGARKTDTIDIVSFADEDDIDPKYFDKPYWIEPGGKAAQKAYALLRDALEKSGKVAVAKYVLREKEHIASIKPEGDALLLNQMRFADELHDGSDLSIPGKVAYSKKELDLAISLIGKLTEKFDIGDYTDTYADELKKIIKAKSKGRIARLKGEQDHKPIPAKDILEALKKSLEEEEVQSR
jgi:DNA end-binding protein Ku